MKYNVIYLWRSERHRVLFDYLSIREAEVDARDLRARGFRAWVESL